MPRTPLPCANASEHGGWRIFGDYSKLTRRHNRAEFIAFTHHSSDAQVLAGTVIFAAACIGIGFGKTLWVLCPLLTCAGMGWRANGAGA